jgi:hypothetical protein
MSPEEDADERPPRVASPVARTASASTMARRAAPAAVARHGFAESAADYSYVIHDLRKIGMFAGGLVTFLIVLSFVYH